MEDTSYVRALPCVEEVAPFGVSVATGMSHITGVQYWSDDVHADYKRVVEDVRLVVAHI